MTLNSYAKSEIDAKFEEKLTCGLEMTWEIWQIFTRALEKSQNWDFDGILSSELEHVWA